MLRITVERKSRGWSQARLARAARLDQSLLSKIEGQKVRPYAGELRRIARALGVAAADADQLLQEVNVQPVEVAGSSTPATSTTDMKRTS